MQQEPAGHTELRVPLFQSIFEQFREDRRYVVLDLGPARSGLIDLLSDFRCRLDIVGLPEILAQLQSMEDPEWIEQAIRRLLPPARGEPVDVVLGWNLLNYLDPERIGILGRILSERLAPRACLHALIEYSSPRMPLGPGSVSPLNSGNLALEPDESAGQVKAPRYVKGVLENALSGMVADRTMLLGNGMQEYLFRSKQGVLK
jgi:hypothetical protein